MKKERKIIPFAEEFNEFDWITCNNKKRNRVKNFLAWNMKTKSPLILSYFSWKLFMITTLYVRAVSPKKSVEN